MLGRDRAARSVAVTLHAPPGSGCTSRCSVTATERADAAWPAGWPQIRPAGWTLAERFLRIDRELALRRRGGYHYFRFAEYE